MGLFSWLASSEKGEKKPHPPGAFREEPLYLLRFYEYLNPQRHNLFVHKPTDCVFDKSHDFGDPLRAHRKESQLT